MQLTRRHFIQTAAVAATATIATRAHAQELKKYKACIIGDTEHGGYGHDMHLAFALRDDVAVVGLADPHEEGRAKRAEEAGAERTYADYREMLEKEKPDIVAVGPRWTTNHQEYLLACAEIGAHGFLEKPIAVDLEQADAMVAAVEAKNLKWQLAYNFRTTPIIEHVKKAVFTDGLIGSFLEMRARGKEDNRAGAEDLIVLGTHLFDMMIYFAGVPKWCSADVTHNGQPATKEHIREASEPLGPIVGNRIHAMYGFDNGTAGYFSSMKSKDGPGGRWGLDMFGTKGIVTIRQDVAPVVHWIDDPTWAAGPSGKAWQAVPGMPEYKIEDQARERHKILVDDLIAAIEEDRAPVANLAHGRNAQEMVQGVFQSWTEGGNRVAIPLQQRKHPLVQA